MTSSTLGEMRCRLAAAAPSITPMAKYVTVKADSGLTYAHLPVVSRKRSREDSNNSINMNQFLPFAATQNLNTCKNNDNYSSGASFSFLTQDFSDQIQLHQLELDRFITHHMESVRLEMEERRRKSSRRIMAAVEESIVKKLKAKDEEIEKMGKLNLALVDRVKSLYVENQIWRDLAERNEATANVLRSNLEQVIAQVEDDNQRPRGVEGGEVELVDDAQSCCGSNDDQAMDNNTKLCRSCGKEEACVLLLPCRHLCLCSTCGSYLHICPLCKSNKSCSLHVNFST